jgi:dTDP-4-amino-4,6-dideoxygalactose transaminase
MVDLRTQILSLESEIREAIDDVLEKCHFILGENVTAVEYEIAALCGAKYGIGVASGTDALTVALAMLGIGPGDEVNR